MIDTHSHIYAEEFDADRAEALKRAVEAGVERLLLPAIDSHSHNQMLEVCRQSNGYCVPMMGLHPTSVNDNPAWREELQAVEDYLKNRPKGTFCAVGEVGLDLYWSQDFKAEQQQAFRIQIEWALAYDLPVVIHVRAAWTEAVTLICEYAGCGLRGVFHAFSGSAQEYDALRACGDFLFGIGGVVTFKKSPLAELVRQMELTELVLETDAPYLTPAPHRGQRNESAYLPYICAKVAELKGVEPEQVARVTTANAVRIFKLNNITKTY